MHDRPAVGGDWYEYDEDGGHLIAPYPHVYVVRDGAEDAARYVAVRIVSYYDPATADSGRFTLAYRVYDGGWASEQEWTTPKNVKEEGALCLDLFTKSERDCGTDLWQLKLHATRWLALEGPIVVARPTLGFRSALDVATAGDVRVATLDGRDSLAGLPSPSSISVLADGPQTSWTDTEWDRASYAVDLPERGMAVGARFVAAGFTTNDDVWLLQNARRSLVRFQVRPVTEGDLAAGLTFTYNKVTVDLLDDTAPAEVPESREVTVDVPGAGERTYVSFEEDELVVDVTGAFHEVPAENTWDLALLRSNDGALRVLLSPGAAAYNATQRDGAVTLDDAMPPERPLL